MCLAHKFDQHVSSKTVLVVMRRMWLRRRIRAANSWKCYNLHKGDSGDHVPNLLKRNFDADRLSEGSDPILHSDMGWQRQHQWRSDRLSELGVRQ